MTTFGWQFSSKVTVPSSGSITVVLPAERPILENLTIWAGSGGRTIVNLSFQTQIGGLNFGAAVTVVGAVAATPIADLGANRRVLPSNFTHQYPGPDPRNKDMLSMQVVITNADTNPANVTVLAAGIAHSGG